MLNIRMKKIMKKQGWLVVAAVLTIGLSSCTRDDIVNGMQAGDSQTINITVGAGIDDDASTRSAVVYNETTKDRTLTFTSGDRLFVQGWGDTKEDEDGITYTSYGFYGLLKMVEGSLSKDGKSAKFTGDLTIQTPKKSVSVVEIEGESFSFTIYTLEKNDDAIKDFEGKDVIGLSANNYAVMVHEDAVEDKDVTVEDENVSYLTDWAADVNTLMTTKMSISGFNSYDAEKRSFTLTSTSGPIFNCAISGLEANASYKITYNEWNTFPTPIKADASGKVTFAFFGFTSNEQSLQFVPLDANGEVNAGGEVLMVNLRARELENDMVYNITSTAYPEGYMMDVAVNATTPSGVSTAIASALETANALIPVNFILSGTVATTSSDKDIIIPTDAVDVSLTFNNVPSEAGGTLGIKTNKAGNPASTANNKIFITIPQSDSPINLNIDAPTSTVALQSTSGGAANFKEVVANTAYNTLIVDDDVTLNNLEIEDGVAMVKDDGVLESWTFAAKTNGDKVIITEAGGIEPLMIQRTDEYGNLMDAVYQIVTENGEPYYAHSLKVVKGEADYGCVYFTNPNTTIPLETVVIADDAVLYTNYIIMKNIVGEKNPQGETTAKIKWQRTYISPYDYHDEGDGNKYFYNNSDVTDAKSLKNIIFEEPEIAIDEYFLADYQAKIAEGYKLVEPRLFLDVSDEIDGCTFNYNLYGIGKVNSNHIISVKNCKFVHVDHNNSEVTVIPADHDLIDLFIPYDSSKASNSIIFENCEFSTGTTFKGGIFADVENYTGNINFKNCKLGGANFTGENTDFIEQIYGVATGQKIIISFNDVPKYEVSADGTVSPIMP